MKILLLLLIPKLIFALNILTDIYEIGKDSKRLTLTVDPIIEVWRFKKYVFNRQGIDPSQYELLLDGKKLHSSYKIGYYNDFSNQTLHFTVQNHSQSKRCTCAYE